MKSQRPSPWTAAPQTRRDVMVAMAMSGVAAACGPAFASTRETHGSGANAHDWDWLIGNWDVWHRRLKERLAGSNDWQEFNGKSALWLTLNLVGDDVFNGKPIKVRAQWSNITAASARWEQASSADGGRTWETNWISELTRKS